MSLLWLVCLQLAVAALYPLVIAALHAEFFAWQWPIDKAVPDVRLSSLSLVGPYSSYLSVIPVVVAICWLVTDTLSQPLWPTLIAVAVPLVLACALGWLLRHRTRSSQRTPS